MNNYLIIIIAKKKYKKYQIDVLSKWNNNIKSYIVLKSIFYPIRVRKYVTSSHHESLFALKHPRSFRCCMILLLEFRTSQLWWLLLQYHLTIWVFTVSSVNWCSGLYQFNFLTIIRCTPVGPNPVPLSITYL